MPMFGREREKLIARTAIGAGGGSACLFLGEPGIGKSALAREIAREEGTTVVAVNPGERMWSYSGLSAVAAGLGGPRGATIDGVLERGRDWPEHLLAEELSRTLHLVRDEPGVLVIDDLDQMDSSSLTVLSFVFGRLRGTGVSVIAMVSALEDRRDFAGLTRVVVERLSFEESVELARSVVGPGAVPAVLHMVALFTGGDPGVLCRVRLTPEEASGDAPLPLPLRVSEDVNGRRRRHVRPSRVPLAGAVLDLLSVGPVFAADRLEQAAAEVGVELDQLVDDGVVTVHGDLARLTDPALRSGHHATLLPDERRRLHAQAAAAHAGRYPGAHQWHSSFLDPTADRGRLLQAAVDLALVGETIAAIEFAERALAGELAPAERTRGLVDLGDALVMRGFDLLGQHYLRRAGDTTDPALRLRAAVAAMRAGAMVDHVVDDAVIAHAADLVCPAGVERLLCENARIHLARGEVLLAVDRLAAIAQGGSGTAEASLLALVVRELGVETPGGAEIDPLPIDASTPIETASLAATVRVLREQYAVARREVGALLECTPRLAPLWRERLLRLRVLTELRAGDPAAARDAVVAWRSEWLPGRAPDAASTLLLAAVAATDPTDTSVDDLVARGRALCRREGSTAVLAGLSAVEGARALDDGRADEAAELLSASRSGFPGDDPATLRVDADLIEALWLSGRTAEARHELMRLEAAAVRHPRRWTTLALARSRAVCRSDRDGVAAFREAETEFRPDDSPLEHLRLAAARERCLPGVEPVVPAPASIAAARSRALSPQEQEVVALVGQGLRNREIAAALFISLRTVELRLTRVYRKLGVTSRVHLLSILHGAAVSRPGAAPRGTPRPPPPRSASAGPGPRV